MIPATRAGAVALAIATLGVCGCGDDDDGTGAATRTAITRAGSTRLTAAERGLLEHSERSIDSYCRRRALAIANPARAPTARQQARAVNAIDRLTELGEQKPAAEVSRDIDLELYLSDLAETLEGSNCDPALVARLDQALAALP